VASKISSPAANRAAALVWCAAIAVVLFCALGFYVVHYGEPQPLVAAEAALVNHSTLVAWWATWLCWPQFLVPLCLVLLIVAWRVPGWRRPIVGSIVVLLLCWICADLTQRIFERPRRLDWVVKHETAFSYPSSHAAIATGFYLLWAWMLWQLRGPVWRIGSVALIVIAVTIMWSRLALGAHYVTDIVGGALLGGAIAAAAGAWGLRR
jgi:undecaprenyl-diphosphatase